ncbi:MAG: hypothetical protein KF689_08645 [Gemmatimonadaceae bacterium]|nr:hypothetical protein [Gemmatimonadaceae bacterium]MCW5826337.1 hypothetical protein [Gemmatimonadaceae bacterium]
MGMQTYIDRDRDSGIRAYQLGPGWIHVQFKDGSVYEWTDRSCGHSNIAMMHRLAVAGDGLNRFINLHVKKTYSRKVR